MSTNDLLKAGLDGLVEKQFSPLDVLPTGSRAEKVTGLVLGGIPSGYSLELLSLFQKLTGSIDDQDLSHLNVVVFGGGTGLSNVIGGDSNRYSWRNNPFSGLKQMFIRLHSIVCITDDGGSTGELHKDLPLIALGDLRHVLISSIRQKILQKRYNLGAQQAVKVAVAIHAIFNYRFISKPLDVNSLLLDTGANLNDLPEELYQYLNLLIERLFTDHRLASTLNRPQCLGNLLLASSVFKQLQPSLNGTELVASYQVVRTATIRGLAEISETLGVTPNTVLPCTYTLSQLQILYKNGVLVTGEHKSGEAQRGYPVDRVIVDFSTEPFVQPEVIQLIEKADILLFAPGSLYSSIIPIFQVPGLASAVRSNLHALKLLVANIWVQKGETDVAPDEPERKFHVSDLIRAYQQNIPGGVYGLFSHILSLDLKDIPASVLQRYALEDKEPILLDRANVRALGFEPIESNVFSKSMLAERGVIQHDPDALALAVKTLWILKDTGFLEYGTQVEVLPAVDFLLPNNQEPLLAPSLRYEKICSLLQYISTERITAGEFTDHKMTESERKWLLERVVEITWSHPDILLNHLQYIRGITLVDEDCWKRCQEWDNVFSFYDPLDRRIKIRDDQVGNLKRFEMAFLVALGQSLLGNYAKAKTMEPITAVGQTIAQTYRVTTREEQQLDSFLILKDVDRYLTLSKMNPCVMHPGQYTRVINGGEGFTPPGLFFGLFYAWYLDNRLASNIEYKLSIMKSEISDLVPEQAKIFRRRQEMITFFRERIFRQEYGSRFP